MPPKRREIPGFDIHPDDDNLIRCRVCHGKLPGGGFRAPQDRGGLWIKRPGAAAHLATDMHQSTLVPGQSSSSTPAQGAVARSQPSVSAAASVPFNPTPAPPQYMSQPLQYSHPHSSVLDSAFDSEPMDVDPTSPLESDDDLDDLTLTEEERIELEAKHMREDQLDFIRALSEMCLGGPDDAENPDAPVAMDPLDELADFEESHQDDSDISALFTGLNSSNDWAPYGSKMMFLIDMIDNLMRFRLSSAQLRIFLWMLKEAGCANVPSLYAVRQVQKSLQVLSVRTEQFKSSLGNTYFCNNINDIIAQDYSNPETSRHLCHYPEESDGPLTEVWQFERWKDLPRDLLTPMYMCGGRHFYVNELARTVSPNRKLYIPVIWIMKNGVLHADAHRVTSTNGVLTVGAVTESIRADSLGENYLDLHAAYGPGLHKMFSADAFSETFPTKMPNPLRTLADGKPLYTSFLNLWSDDVSGNVSKQYNKHMNFCFTHACLPGRLLQKEFHIHFGSTSPHASSLEQFEAVQQMIVHSQSVPFAAYYAARNEECLVRNVAICDPADNPQQSAECSHIGMQGNHMCRGCEVGGDGKYKASAKGYNELFEVQAVRSPDKTLAEIKSQLLLAMTGVQTKVEVKQTESGIKDAIAQYWIDRLVDEARKLRFGPEKLKKPQAVERLKVWLAAQTSQPFNPLFAMPGLNPHRDTPVEILHTVLLGIVRYTWHAFYSAWGKHDPEVFIPRQDSIDNGGLSSDPVRPAYVVQYKNNLIGRHFKTLMQTISFHAYAIASDQLQDLMCSVGELGSMLWFTEINDLETYLSDLDILIDNVLDAFNVLDPTRIIFKTKLHVLKHLVPDIRRSGLAVRFSTETFESFNSVFRLCSTHSNRQAPSRDIAIKFANMERIKHTISGGFWYDGGKLRRAGEAIITLRDTSPILRQYLGWKDDTVTIGKYQLAGTKERLIPDLRETTIFGVLPSSARSDFATYPWMRAKSVTVASGDECRSGSWVYIRRDGTAGEVLYGRVAEILATSAAIETPVLLAVDRFDLANERHPTLRMPVLFRTSLHTAVLVRAKEIQFVFNAQHDCAHGECAIELQDKVVMQERQPLQRKLPTLVHKNDTQFILNMHALHNAHLLRRHLPRSLTEPHHTHTDRTALHNKLAESIRTARATNRSQADTASTTAVTATATTRSAGESTGTQRESGA